MDEGLDVYHFFLQGILNDVWKHKLIFVETPDAGETSVALENYRRVSLGDSACLAGCSVS
jgi:hypothetical protein